MGDAWRRRLAGGSAVLFLAVCAAVAAASGASAATSGGQVYVVQGLVDTSVAVQLDGKEIAAEAQPKSVVGPLQVAPGKHVLALRAQGRTMTSASFTASAGGSQDLVAYRTADTAQAPRIVVFRNDLSSVGPGKSRLVLAHAAVAPPVDVRLDGRVLSHDVAQGESLSLLAPAKSYSVDLVTSAGGATVLGPVNLTPQAGTLTRVFVVGDPTKHSIDAVVQALPVPVTGSTRPSRVPTGDGGQAADSFVTDPRGVVPLAALAAGGAWLLLLSGTRPVRRVLAPRTRRHAR
jgi:hypothetical protein